MTTLLHEKLAPITFRVGFLNSSFTKIQDAFIQWKRQHFRSVQYKGCDLPLENALLELEPLTATPRRWLLVPTTSDWVGYFDNGVRGPDPVPVISHMAAQLGCRGVIATYIPHTLFEETGTTPGLYGAVQFELFAPHKTDFLNYERTVSVAYEGGKWRFDATGAVQSFEDPAKYQNRRIIDRFTPEMLKTYCRALNIDVDSISFYRAPSVLVFASDPLPEGWVAHTIAQAQEQMGLTSSVLRKR
jgi:hypothetical protein